ncbi:MAG: aminotransferase class I/II-fold pyridoxal phosphate-dependent enzyme [bacterium]|nr:aminotransferase class I/II-fold pyridoxal phosphate-dependent enzyme [bacterium]
MTSPAARLGRLPVYPFAALTQRVREMNARGLDVINLDMGSPDMPPPPHVIETLARSAANPLNHGYAGYKGIPEFRTAVARYYDERFGVMLDPETQVLPLMGSKEGIVNLILAYVDQGDVVLTPDIGYPSYAMGALLAGGEPYYVPTPESGGYLPDLESVPLGIRQRAKILWVNYPNNPTGACADAAFYAQAVAFCAEHDLLLASDHPYCDVTFDGYRAGSALQAPGAFDHSIELISFSKSYNMAGWRLGAAVGSVAAIKTLLTVKSNMDSGHFRPVYDAGIAALETPSAWVEARNAVYQARRDRILEMLPHIGLRGYVPKGALYIWAEVLSGTGVDYAEAALTHARVSVAPGTFYGPGGTRHVRFSLCAEDARLEQALTRLKTWYASR